MTFTYELMPSGRTVKRTDENGNICWIPVDEDNADYRDYLASLQEQDGNE